MIVNGGGKYQRKDDQPSLFDVLNLGGSVEEVETYGGLAEILAQCTYEPEPESADYSLC